MRNACPPKALALPLIYRISAHPDGSSHIEDYTTFPAPERARDFPDPGTFPTWCNVGLVRSAHQAEWSTACSITSSVAGITLMLLLRRNARARLCPIGAGGPHVIQSDDDKISEDRREALRYALAIGSGAALAASVASPASAQATPDNTLDRIRANKVLRIAVLPGELPYFNKDLATGNWSGFSIEMANDIAKLLDVKLEYTESTYGNSILDLQSNKIDLGFALNPTPQRALVVDFCGTVFHHPFGAMLKKGMEAKTWADINKSDVNIAVDVGSANEAVARRFAPNATIKSLKSRDEVMLEMSSGRVDCVVNALVLGLTAIAKNPNLGTYKILQTPAVAIPSSMAVRREPDKRWRDFLSVWVDYNRGIGQMREWFLKGLSLSGVKLEDVPVELNI
jgi:polar amino acid transport system substrate-binding protein